MKLITPAELRKSKEKTKLDDDSLVVCAMATNAKASDDEQSRVIDFTISSETADSYRDVVSADGWNLERFLKNPVVLWAHIKSQLPVGKASNIRTDGDTLKAAAEFASRDIYEFADDVFKMLKAGFLNAVSVGFIPLEWTWDDERGGYNFIKNELFEFSVVPVPANPDALANAIESGEDLGPIREWCERTLDAWRPDGHTAIWVPRNHVEDIHKLVNGSAAMISFTGDQPDITSWSVTSTGNPSADVVDNTSTGGDYHEFWSPSAPVDLSKGEEFKLPENWMYRTHQTDPEVPRILGELSEKIEALEKQIETLTEKAQKVDPPDAPEDDELELDAITEMLLPAVEEILRKRVASEDDDLGFEFDPDVLRSVVEADAAKAIQNRTGKLPKEV